LCAQLHTKLLSHSPQDYPKFNRVAPKAIAATDYCYRPSCVVWQFNLCCCTNCMPTSSNVV